MEIHTNNIETSVSIKNGKMFETQSQNGKVMQVSVFEDLNKDGKYDANEVTTVYKYDYKDDGRYKETMYDDSNKDGTLDAIRIQQYDKNGQKTGATIRKDIKEKCCDAHSNMQNIKSGKSFVFHIPSWDIEY